MVTDHTVQERRKSELRENLSEVRTRTLALMAEVSDEFLRRRVHDFYSPIGWHFGHVGRTEEYWVCKATGLEPSDPNLSFIYADLADNPKDNRVNIPDRAGTIAYLESTRRFALDVLEETDLDTKDPCLQDGYAWEFAIQHECQHHETIAEMLHLIQQQMEPARVTPLDWIPGVESRMIPHPGGVFEMGCANIHGYDNEKNPHEVKVEDFSLSEYLITCYQWFEFMNSGGYSKPELWSMDGWRWREQAKATMPHYWIDQEGSYAQVGPFGVRALHPDEPVMGVSQYEAEAFANWRGNRLPTEEEWEYAASAAGSRSKRKFAWGEAGPDGSKACHTLLGWSPNPVGSAENGRTPLGVADMTGNVWEWTSSSFLPYPGFEAFPYEGYSKDHMRGLHRVCRGGSWATSAIILRNTFRNWYVPSYRQGFLGLRLASG